MDRSLRPVQPPYKEALQCFSCAKFNYLEPEAAAHLCRTVIICLCQVIILIAHYKAFM